MTNVRVYRVAAGDPPGSLTRVRLYGVEVNTSGIAASVSPAVARLDAGEGLTLTGSASGAESRGWWLGGVQLTDQPVLQIAAPPLLVDETRTYEFRALGPSGTAVAPSVVSIVRADWRQMNEDGTLTPFVAHLGPWTPPPVTPPFTPPSTDPTAMPVGALAGGWTQVYAEDFATPVAEGGFITRTSGDLGLLTPDNPYASSWKAKERLSIPPGEPNTRYDAQTTMSVVPSVSGVTANGVLRTRLQKLADGTLRAGACKPIFGNGVDFQQPTRIRWRSWASGAAGFSYVFDFIGSNESWMNGGGELGFPENGVPATDAHIFYRPKTATTTGAYTVTSLSSGVDQRQPHIYEVTWLPGVSLVGTIDGVVKLTDTNPATVWSDPMRWLMQSGGSSSAVVGTEGLLFIDWISVWTAAA